VAYCASRFLGVCYMNTSPKGAPVKTLQAVLSSVAVLTVFWAGPLAAQATSASTTCTWNCHNVHLPLGLAVAEVIDGGSFVTLEDGSVWEIRMPQRPVASSWVPGDFVELRNVLAPVDRFEILLAHGDSDYAEARFAGRKRIGGAAGQQ
jgi:hypothetical protein